LLRIQERGVAVPSSTRIGSKYARRYAIINHLSRLEDFDALAQAAVELGRELLAELKDRDGRRSERASS